MLPSLSHLCSFIKYVLGHEDCYSRLINSLESLTVENFAVPLCRSLEYTFHFLPTRNTMGLYYIGVILYRDYTI